MTDSSKIGSITINAPYDSRTVSGATLRHGLVEHWIAQLKSFRGKAPSAKNLEKDIAGYESLLAASEETIGRFMELKQLARAGKRPHKWNDEIVEELKASGQWQVKP